MVRVRVSAVLCGLLVSAFSLLTGAASPDHAQSRFSPPAAVAAGHGLVQVMPLLGHPPVEITGVEIGSRSIAPDKPFAANADWIQHLRITFKNVSKVPVTVINIEIRFPETGSPQLMASLYAGHVPAAYRTLRDGRVAHDPGVGVLMLLPGESYTMDAGAQISNRFLKIFAGDTKPSAFPDRCRVSLVFVAMKDGSSWIGGHYRKADTPAP